MLIEIKGVQFVNKGAELMLFAILQQLDSLENDFSICLSTNPNTPPHKLDTINAYRRIQLRKNIIDLNPLSYFIPRFVRQFLKKHYKIVFEADIDVVLDASGFAYGDQWSDLILRQVATEITRLKKKHKKYVFLPQSLGPFSRESNKKWAHFAFNHAALIYARETTSYQAVLSLGSNIKVKQAPDFTNLVTAALPSSYQSLKGAVLLIPNAKMLSAKNKNAAWKTHYINLLSAIANQVIATKKQVVILNHSPQDDHALCEAIQSKLDTHCEIITPANALEVKAIIGCADAVISSRFHGCVSALSQGVVCLATGWSHKYQELFSEYGACDYLLEPNISTDYTTNATRLILHPTTEMQKNLHQRSEQYKQQSKNMWAEVLPLLTTNK